MASASKEFELSPESMEKIRVAIEEHNEKHTPAAGNICKEDGCGGRVVQKVSGYFRGQFTYRHPECDKCGRVYFYANDAIHTGEEKMWKSFFRRINF